MHSAFDPKNLDQLPVALKKLAVVAGEKDCPDAKMSAFVSLWASSTSKRRALFLPVFWMLLDPELIPRSNDLDNPSDSTTRVIRHAMMSLPKVYATEMSPAAIKAIWPRVLAWVDFAQTYFDSFPADSFVDVPGQHRLLVDFVIFTSAEWQDAIRGRTPSADTLPSPETPRFLSLLIHAWDAALEAYTKQEGTRTDIAVCAALCLSPFTASLRERIIEAAGGLESLAAIIHKHVVVCTPFLRVDYTSSTPSQEFPLVATAMNWIALLDARFTDVKTPPLAGALSARHALKDFIAALTKLTEPSNARRAQQHEPLWYESVATIINAIGPMLLHGHRAIRTALRLGLLSRIAEAAAYPMRQDLISRLEQLFTRILPSGFMYLSVLKVLPGAVAQVENNQTALGYLRGSRILNFWNEFVSATKMQGQLFRMFPLLPPPSRCCDNVSCGYIGIAQRSSFRQCSGCRARIYCSERCQKSDWCDGGHRQICSTARDVNTNIRRIFTKRQLAFFRFTLNMEYSTQRSRIHCNAALAPAANRTISSAASDPRKVNMTMFDFLWGAPGPENPSSISSHPAHDPEIYPTIMQADPTFDDWIQRARRSNGRLVLHLMHVHVGQERRWLLLPLRMNMSFFEDTAARLARTIPRPLTENGFARMRREFEQARAPSQLQTLHQ
ncbi:hypothetical protein C8F01DRAFT_1371777 [Mycena amicta]|nr:hypothetical protein C8F01DRAFT_1371777 [Mycena amicta]